MLRRAENCVLAIQKTLFGRRRLTLHIGRRSSHFLGKVSATDVDELLRRQGARPVYLTAVGERHYWRFQDRYYWDNDGLSENEVYALLVTRQERERKRIERAEAMVAQGFTDSSSQRGAIPDDVKQFVWRRDGGRCRSCGSTTELQFDHIIPVAMGGATTEDNLQVLCGPCNRRKGAGLTTS